MTKDEAFRQRFAWAICMSEIARKHGDGSKIYRAMGSLAWGRYEDEPSAADGKDRAVRAIGYLQGTRDALLRVAEMGGWPGAEDLRKIHERVWERLHGGAPTPGDVKTR